MALEWRCSRRRGFGPRRRLRSIARSGTTWGAAYSGFCSAMSLADEGDLERRSSSSARACDDFASWATSTTRCWPARSLRASTRTSATSNGPEHCTRTTSVAHVRSPTSASMARSLGQLASHARDEGRVEDALAMLKESLRILRDLGDRLGIADDLGRLARTLAVAGRAGDCRPAPLLLGGAPRGDRPATCRPGPRR